MRRKHEGNKRRIYSGASGQSSMHPLPPQNSPSPPKLPNNPVDDIPHLSQRDTLWKPLRATPQPRMILRPVELPFGLVIVEKGVRVGRNARGGIHLLPE